MEVEYNEKPRTGAFPIKLVGCDNEEYVNLNNILKKYNLYVIITLWNGQ